MFTPYSHRLITYTLTHSVLNKMSRACVRARILLRVHMYVS